MAKEERTEKCTRVPACRCLAVTVSMCSMLGLSGGLGDDTDQNGCLQNARHLQEAGGTCPDVPPLPVARGGLGRAGPQAGLQECGAGGGQLIAPMEEQPQGQLGSLLPTAQLEKIIVQVGQRGSSGLFC